MDLSRLALRSALIGRTAMRGTDAGNRISRARRMGGLHQGIDSGVAFDLDTSWIDVGNRLRRLAPNHQLILVDLDARNKGGDNILLGNIFCFCSPWRRVQMRLERRYDRGLDLRGRNTSDDARSWCGDTP